ncbi:MAG: DUF2997 domain-containing protein [bacterium]|jgi:hypothetical protein
MANVRELEIVIKPDGKVEITVRGIKGPDCKPVAEKVGCSLGAVELVEKTSEWYESATTVATEQKVSRSG